MSLSLPSHSVILSPPSLDSFTIDRTEPVEGAQGETDHFLSIPLLVALGVAAINQAIKEGKAAQTERVLRNPAVGLRGVVPDCADGYQRLLEDAMAKKQRPGSGLTLPLPLLASPSYLSPPLSLLCLFGFCLGDTALWVQHDMKDGTAYYFHLQTFQGTWERPPACRLNTSHLTREEIQVGGAPVRVGARGWELSCGRGSRPPGHDRPSLLLLQSAVTKVTAARDRQQLWKANVGFIIRLQARFRGFLVRQKFAERSHFLRTWLPAVVKIQVADSGLLRWQSWTSLRFRGSSCFLFAEWSRGGLLASVQ